MSETPRLTIAILVFDGVEELDFVGPWEVFCMAAQTGAPLDVITVGWPSTAITCAKGLRITADHALANAPKADIVVVPGGRGTRDLVKDQAFLDMLKPYLDAAQWQTSVCTGAFLLGKTGYLDGIRATTHWNAFDTLRAAAPLSIPVTDQRVVRVGQVVTSAGVSAGIDMALWLTGYLFGEDRARTTQKHMEYFPEPPYGNAD